VGANPEAATVNVAVPPEQITAETGCVITDGAMEFTMME